MNINDFAIQE